MAGMRSPSVPSVTAPIAAHRIELHSSHAHYARTAVICPAQPSGAEVPQIDEAEWDPEGLLPPTPAGGHFARRGEAATAATATAAPPAATPTSPIAKSLLAKKTPASTKARLPSLGQTPTMPAAPAMSGGDAIITAPSSGVGAAIDAAFRETFWGERAAPRVLDSFRRLASGQEHVALFPGEGLQRAESFVEGLTACAFPDPYSGAYPWLEEVERQAAVIKSEFEAVSADPNALTKGNNVWVSAARKDAVGYGRAWRTLVLQDRGVWDPINSKIFPRTSQLMKDLKAPTLEVFFARQQANTGITSHTDNANFVQTSHLGLDVPEGQCWIKVGEHTKEWRNGKVITMDTSFMHETANESPDKDRYVLIMRHWHPELKPLERIATMFLFRALDDSSPEGIRAAQKEADKAMKGLTVVGVAKAKGKGKTKMAVPSGGGFGKKA